MTRVGKPRATLAGVLAAVGALAVGHLVAGFLNPAASPVLAVGSAVIDLTPTPLKEWAIRTFGTADKAVLVGSVAVLTLVFAAVTGLLARRRFGAGAVMLVVLVAMALVAALTRPAATAKDAVPAVVAALIGVVLLALLLPVRLPSSAPAWLQRATATPEHAKLASADGATSRRRFLVTSGTVVVGSAGAALAGQQLARGGNPTAGVRLPSPARTAPRVPAGLETSYPGITPLRTPNAKFYRVDTALTIPKVDPETWELRIDGDVRQPYTLTYADLQDPAKLIERNITMTCVSNEVGGPYVGGATWLGVRTADLLRRAEVIESERPDRQLLSTSVDGFTSSTPLGALTDDRDALLAIGMNGTVLPPVHGFPARLVTPGLYGFVGSTKWITRMRVTGYPAAKAYWTKRGWATDAPIKPSARIDVPESLSQVPNGQVTIGGIAWAQRQGVVGVEVSIDGQGWQPAQLGPDVGVDYWRQWAAKQAFTPGRHSVRARVRYAPGKLQSAARAGVFPSGSSGIQEVVFFVT